MRFLHNARVVEIDPFEKKFFSGVSTMCLQLGSFANQPVINCHALGSGTNQLVTATNHLDGVNKMVCYRQTSEFGRGLGIIFHDIADSVDSAPQWLSQKSTILATNICQ